MKQLVLYFLFFVGFALILVQCAKLFPTKTKSDKQQLKSNSGIGVENRGDPSKTTAVFTTMPGFTPVFRAGLLKRKAYFLDFDAAPHLDDHALFYNPTVGFGYYNLLRNYKNKLQIVK